MGSKNIAEIDAPALIQLMVGREAALERSNRAAGTEVALQADGLTLDGAFSGVAFTVRLGEVVGLAGLVGSGRSEVAQALCGIRPATSGTVAVFGKEELIHSLNDAMRLGLGYVPEDRRHQGLALPRCPSRRT